MADSRIGTGSPENFKEAVCIDAGRVYDSCCDRDCLEDLRVYFGSDGQQTVQNALSVRIKSAEVLNVMIDVEPVNFNRGFYSCDLTFFFLVFYCILFCFYFFLFFFRIKQLLVLCVIKHIYILFLF